MKYQFILQCRWISNNYAKFLKDKKSAYPIIPLIWYSRKCKLLFNDSEQTSCCLIGRGGGGRDYKGAKEHEITFGGDQLVYYPYCGDGFMGYT